MMATTMKVKLRPTARYIHGLEKTTAHLDARLSGNVQMVVGPGNYLVLDPATMRAFAISLNAMADEVEGKA